MEKEKKRINPEVG